MTDGAALATPTAGPRRPSGRTRSGRLDPGSHLSRVGWVTKAATAVGLLLMWQLLSSVGALDPGTVAAPASILGALIDIVARGTVWADLAMTLLGWSLGLALSAAVAIPVGMLLGTSDVCYRSFRFTLDFLRTIPPVALVPLALLLYGNTTQMKLVLVVLGSLWPMLLQTMYGVHQIDPGVRETARSFRMDRRRRTFFIALPGALPFITTGVRISATMALLLTIGAELIGSAPGLGSAIGLAQQASDVPLLYALITVSALLGVALNALFVALERRLVSWHASQR